MNASLFNISPGISSGTMNLAMPFLAANAGTGFGETDLYDSLALELGSSEADPHALPQVIQGAPVQHSSIVGAWRRHALMDGRVNAAPLQIICAIPGHMYLHVHVAYPGPQSGPSLR